MMSLRVCVLEFRRSVLTAMVESDPRYPKYAALLSPGWIPGRKVVSDLENLNYL
jgi:hypothetical protein